MKLEPIARVGVTIALLAMVFMLARPFGWNVGASGAEHAKLTPQLRPGEAIQYDIRGRLQRNVKTESHVGIPTAPADTKLELTATLRVKVKQVKMENGRPVVDAQAEFEYPPAVIPANQAKEKRVIDFTIGANGQLVRAAGLEELQPMERIAWQFWISRFAFGSTLSSENVRRGEKFKSEEAELNPSPIGNLVWERETIYGEDGKCPAVTTETCAVFFTSASLKQKSSPKDATPEEYKLHDLKTSGTAAGTNETYTMISQKTGLAVRGTEDVKQSMTVVIAKADASNAVKYTVDANSHFEMMLIVGAPGH
jgi:hypothetical protein